MKWRFQAFDWDDASTKRELRAAKNRHLTLRLKSSSSLNFSMDGHNDQTLFVKELITDILASVDGVDLCRLRVGPATDSVGQTGHGVSFQSGDYRQVLARRRLNADDTLFYPVGTDDATIVWGMVSAIQARTNGDYGIVQGLGFPTTGDTSQATLTPGQFVGPQIDQLATKEGGFDWDVGPDMAINLYDPLRGADRGVTLEYPKSISSFTRTKTASGFANDMMTTGDQSTIPVTRQEASIDTAPEGRWDGVQSYPSTSDQSTIIDKAPYDLAARSKNLPNYTMNLVPGFWRGPSHIGLGDTVGVRVKSLPRLNEYLTMRVLEIGINVSDDALSESVQITAVPV